MTITGTDVNIERKLAEVRTVPIPPWGKNGKGSSVSISCDDDHVTSWCVQTVYTLQTFCHTDPDRLALSAR